MTCTTPPFFTVAENGADRTYAGWLDAHAKQLARHDRKRGYHVHPVAYYKAALNTAVHRSGGRDEYSGEAIDWSLAFDHRCGAKGAAHRRKFSAAPSIDHITGGGLGVAICRDDVNTAKGCMTLNRFRELCARVAAAPITISGPTDRPTPPNPGPFPGSSHDPRPSPA